MMRYDFRLWRFGSRQGLLLTGGALVPSRRMLIASCLLGGCGPPVAAETKRATTDNGEPNVKALRAKAIAAYGIFYPIIALEGLWRGVIRAGGVANRIFLYGTATPLQLAVIADSDAPCAT